MKKVTVLAATFALFGFISIDANAQAQEAPAQQATEQSAEQATEQQAATEQAPASAAQADNATANKEKISQEQLPAPVKEVLAQDAFKEWKVEEVYKIAAVADGEKTTYEVICTNAAQEKGIVRIDEAGTVLKDEPKQ